MQDQAQTTVDQDFDELNALLAPAAVADETDAFDELEALLSESIAISKEAKDVKASRLALKRNSSVMDATERAFIEAKVAEWEARNVWTTIELVAVFRQQTCACGLTHRTFSHFMHHQQHRTDAFAQRWVSTAAGVPDQSDSIPRTVAFSNSIIPICEYCAEHDGFDLDAASVSWEAGNPKAAPQVIA